MHFIIFVLWPTIFARFLIYLKLRNANYVQMQNCLFFLKVFYNITYGIWTVHNILEIVKLPNDSRCESNGTNLLELNYEVVIIFGVLPALLTAFFLTVSILCAPYVVYLIYQNH